MNSITFPTGNSLWLPVAASAHRTLGWCRPGVPNATRNSFNSGPYHTLRCEKNLTLPFPPSYSKPVVKLVRQLLKTSKRVSNIKSTNQPWPVWLCGVGAVPQSERSQARFPVRAQAWAAGQAPGCGHTQEATGPCVSLTLRFLSLSFSLPSPL